MRGKKRCIAALPLNAAESARVLGLRYVTDRAPGIRRSRAGHGFRYVTAQGLVIKDPDQVKRFRALVIPPAWTDVWICPSPNGHLQATGRDQRGRKQYRYHALYRKVRNETKYSRMTAFAAALPRIRRQLRVDLSHAGLPREKVLATVVSLLERTCIRVGNDEYAEQNESYGLTTLRENHVSVRSDAMRFHFRGKSGRVHDISVHDRKLAQIVRQCQHLPGQELFQYLDPEGTPRTVSSEDVNDYLRAVSGDEFTAKDFRTWRGTVEAVAALEALGPAPNRTATKKNLVAAVKTVAQKLGNRPATSKTYYIHPAVLEAYESGSFFDRIAEEPRGENGLNREERLVVEIIERSERENGDVLTRLKQPAA